MKVFLKCTHDVDNAEPKLITKGKELPFTSLRKLPEDDERLFYPCWSCDPSGFSLIEKMGNSDADQRTHTSRLANP